MSPRRHILGYVFFGAASLGMAFSLFVILIQLIQEQRGVAASFREGVIWNAMHCELESRLLLQTILQFIHGDPAVSQTEVSTRFDILWSRVDVVSHGDMGKAFAKVKGANEAIAQARELLPPLEPLILGLQRGDTQTLETLARPLQALTETFHEVVLAANDLDARNREERQQHYRKLYADAIALLAGALLSGALLILLIAMNMRSLNVLRAGLEERVAERTHDLRTEIAERRRTEQTLLKFSQALQQSPSAVIIFDRAGKIEYVNPRFAAVTGQPLEGSIGGTSEILMSPELPPDMLREPWLTVGAGGEWHREYRQARADGSWFWIDASLTPIRSTEGEVTHYLFVGEDVSLRKEHEARLLRQATLDTVTGLPNRLLADDRLAQALANAERTQQKMGLLFIDLDKFKQINDTLGHHAGDQLLVQVGERLSRCVRKHDTVARLGGDEFIVVAPDIVLAADVEVVVKKLIAVFEQPFVLDGHPVMVTGSIGVALYPDDGETRETLMRSADAALYQAKEAGRNTYRFFARENNGKKSAEKPLGV
ncbi:MAG: diguanylate cyclase [Gammaproteobacteria bacterium]